MLRLVGMSSFTLVLLIIIEIPSSLVWHVFFILLFYFLGLQRCDGIPHFMHSSLLDKFTEGGGGGARGGAKGSQHSFTQKMKDKVMLYLFAIALRVSGYSLNSTTLQRDPQISSNKLAKIHMLRVRLIVHAQPNQLNFSCLTSSSLSSTSSVIWNGIITRLLDKLWIIVHGGQWIESAQKIHASRGS